MLRWGLVLLAAIVLTRGETAFAQDQAAPSPAQQSAPAGDQDEPAAPPDIVPPASEGPAASQAADNSEPPAGAPAAEGAGAQSAQPRSSGYQPQPALPPISGGPPTAPAVVAPFYKMEFTGCQGGVFHLVDKIGTAHYSLGGREHLAILHFDKADAKYTYYVAELGDPLATKWSFSRLPDAPGQYSVWRLTRNGWTLFDLARVSRPR